MSTSARPIPQTAGRPAVEVRPFPYDAVSAPRPVHGFIAREPELTAAELSEREARARSLGREEGQAEARQEFEKRLAKERESLSAAVREFCRDREGYFQKIESEVVQLALSIARKILHREAQIDPLLLVGIVHVALEKIDGATAVRLRVHPQNSAEWQRYLGARLEPGEMPEIIEDPSRGSDTCTLETSMGTAEIGLEAQLKEIEQGLTDLLAARPGVS
jgi:flagellar assembly protein FliH